MAGRLAVYIAPAAVVVALYAPALHGGLLGDDRIHIPYAAETSVARLLLEREHDYRRPLVLLSYRMQSALGLDRARDLHAANLALHAVNATLLLAVLRARFRLSILVAASAALLFAAHPVHTAAVAYVSGRTDLLMAAFALLALLVSGARRVGTLARTLLTVAAVAAAGLAKESGLVTGPLVALATRLREGDNERAEEEQRRRARDAPRRRALAVAALVTTALVGVFAAPVALSQALEVPIATRLSCAGATFRTHLGLLVAPRNLHLDRLAAIQPGLDTGLGALAIGLIAIAILGAVRRTTPLRFAAAAAALLWLPVSNLLPIYPALAGRWVFAGEHLLYAPMLALAPLVAAGLCGGVQRLGAPRRLAQATTFALCTGVVAAAAPLLRTAIADLSDAERAYRNTLAHSPSPRACFNLGVELLARGADRDAAAIYERCAELSPNDAAVYVQLGVAYQRAGDRNKAELAYARAIELAPGDPYAWSNYASLDAAAGFYEDARRKWQRALELEPDFAPAHAGLEKLKMIEARRREPRPPF